MRSTLIENLFEIQITKHQKLSLIIPFTYRSYFLCHDAQIGVMSGKSQMTSVMHQLIVPAQRIVDNERNQPAAGENRLRFSCERKRGL